MWSIAPVTAITFTWLELKYNTTSILFTSVITDFNLCLHNIASIVVVVVVVQNYFVFCASVDTAALKVITYLTFA